MRKCQKRPTCMAKEANQISIPALRLGRLSPYMRKCQKRPTYMAKETYLYGKRGLFRLACLLCASDDWALICVSVKRDLPCAYLYGKRGLFRLAYLRNASRSVVGRSAEEDFETLAVSRDEAAMCLPYVCVYVCMHIHVCMHACMYVCMYVAMKLLQGHPRT